jgi:hypothetical protein
MQKGANTATILPLLKEKFAARGLDVGQLSLTAICARRAEFERDWKRNLLYLLPRGQEVSFLDAWKTTLALLERVELGKG